MLLALAKRQPSTTCLGNQTQRHRFPIHRNCPQFQTTPCLYAGQFQRLNVQVIGVCFDAQAGLCRAAEQGGVVLDAVVVVEQAQGRSDDQCTCRRADTQPGPERTFFRHVKFLRLDARDDGLPHMFRYRLLGQRFGQAGQAGFPSGHFGTQGGIVQQQVLKASAGGGRHQADGVIGGQRTAQAGGLIVHDSRHLRRRSMPRRIQDLTEPRGAANCSASSLALSP